MPGAGPGGVLVLYPYPDQTRVDGKPISSTYRGMARKLAARSSITTRSFAWARVITAPRRPDLWPSDPAGLTRLARRRGTQSCGPPLRRPCAGLVADAAAPAITASGRGATARGPRPFFAVTPDHRGWHCGGCRRAGPGKRRSCWAESGKAPPCMRWRGLARPRRAKPTSSLALLEPRAARGARYPYEGPVSRLHHVPEVTPSGTRFQR